MVSSQTVEIESPGNCHTVNITDRVRSFVAESGVVHGSVLIFYRHTTGAVLATEHEVGLLVDLEDVLERFAPIDADWKHHRRGADANGGAHMRAAFLNQSLTIPIIDGELAIGTFQEIVVADFDPVAERRPRKLILQVTGE
jgi:secondary thiamine-phosphate synthase enzyme